MEKASFPTPLGPSFSKENVTFSCFSNTKTQVRIGFFLKNMQKPYQVHEMQRTGNYWHISLPIPPEEILYAFQIGEKWVNDPYAKSLYTESSFGASERTYRSLLSFPSSFDWENVTPPRHTQQNLIIYEMHVRGFTQHPSSHVAHPGSFLGMIEKIPYLKQLGITAVELMPIFEFDEMEHHRMNYWGYQPLFFMTPMTRYGSIEDFKTLVRELHRNGIEIILDVVFNHTGKKCPLKTLDRKTYYMHNSHGHDLNFSGCGNTLNVNHPITQRLILDSLQYWMDEMHVDGFRFDLASIFTRDQDGSVLKDPEIIQKMTELCFSRQVKLIAEAWDAAGLYQVGRFPRQWKGWLDWDGVYRDSVRKFIKGTEHQSIVFAQSFCGLRSNAPHFSGIHFVTAHDGFNLYDLVTYQKKQNEANGENNQDGENHNHNWNCGAEGPSSDPQICHLREKQMRNFLVTLLLSQGVPMLLMGDEYGHTRKGNNNPYAQDNELNWFLWDALSKNQKQCQFVQSLIAFRKKQIYFTPSAQFHGPSAEPLNANIHSKFVAIHIKQKNELYFVFNMSPNTMQVTLPKEKKWLCVLNTEEDWNQHCLQTPHQAPALPREIPMTERSILVAFTPATIDNFTHTD